MITCESMPSIEVSSDPDPTSVQVAVAVIFNAEGEVLLTRRHAESDQGGLWEFPGGKLESGETPTDALCRELREELAIGVLEHEPLMQVTHDYGDKRVLLNVQRVTQFSGEPQPCEGQPMRWVSISQLCDYAFPAANAEIVKALAGDFPQ